MTWFAVIASCCLWPSIQSWSASAATATARDAVWFRKDDDQICAGLGTSERDSDVAQCLSTRDFTQEELLNLLEPLLARIPANAPGRTSWRAIIGSLAVTLSTWTLMLSCLRICCRQKAGKKARLSCTLLHRWARDCGDVFFTFPLTGVKMVLDTMIVSPLSVAQAALLRRRAAQTMRMQDQLLAEGGHTPGAGRKRERASTIGLAQRSKRKSATTREKPKEPARSSTSSRPRSAFQEVPEPRNPGALEEEEPTAEQWCQVHRHSEHPKRVLPTERHRPVVEGPKPVARTPRAVECPSAKSQALTQKVEASPPKPSWSPAETVSDSTREEPARPPSRAEAPRELLAVLKTVPPSPPAVAVAEGCAPTVCASERSSPGAPPDAPLPPTRRPWNSAENFIGENEDPELPLLLAPLAPPPVHPPKLSGAAEPNADVQREETEDEDILEPERPPPPDMPPPPCPAGQEILRWLQQPPKRESVMPVVTDMGCFSGGTGGTPGWDGVETTLDYDEAYALQPPCTKSECPSRFAEDDVGKRLEAMVEELAGPSSFKLLEDAFSKVDAAREALSKVVSEPGLHHAAPVFIPGQLWPGGSRKVAGV